MYPIFEPLVPGKTASHNSNMVIMAEPSNGSHESRAVKQEHPTHYYF